MAGHMRTDHAESTESFLRPWRLCATAIPWATPWWVFIRQPLAHPGDISRLGEDAGVGAKVVPQGPRSFLLARVRHAGAKTCLLHSGFAVCPATAVVVQAVCWHAASEGLKTVDTLQQGLATHVRTAPDVATDPEALASVFRVATDRRVDCSVVLRLHAAGDCTGLVRC